MRERPPKLASDRCERRRIPTSARPSRYAYAIFVCAMVNFAFGLASPALGYAWLLAPASLMVIRALTIGWLTLLMFGGLFHFVPVITARDLPRQTVPLLTLLGIASGLALMVGGFFALSRDRALALGLPVGGCLVLLAMLVGASGLLLPLSAKRPTPLSARFVLTRLGFLLLTVILGPIFAAALALPALGSELAVLFDGGLGDHALTGIGGWFTLTAIGVSYELLPISTRRRASRRLLFTLSQAETEVWRDEIGARRLHIAGGP